MRRRPTKVEQLEALDAMLWKKALRTWRQLSPELRLWMDVEDLYQEAYLEALRVWDRWTPRQAKFSTFVFKAVDNRMLNLRAHWQAQRRAPVGRVSEDVLDWEGVDWRKSELLVDAVVQYVVVRLLPEAQKDAVVLMVV